MDFPVLAVISLDLFFLMWRSCFTTSASLPRVPRAPGKILVLEDHITSRILYLTGPRYGELRVPTPPPSPTGVRNFIINKIIVLVSNLKTKRSHITKSSPPQILLKSPNWGCTSRITGETCTNGTVDESVRWIKRNTCQTAKQRIPNPRYFMSYRQNTTLMVNGWSLRLSPNFYKPLSTPPMLPGQHGTAGDG